MSRKNQNKKYRPPNKIKKSPYKVLSTNIDSSNNNTENSEANIKIIKKIEITKKSLNTIKSSNNRDNRLNDQRKNKKNPLNLNQDKNNDKNIKSLVQKKQRDKTQRLIIPYTVSAPTKETCSICNKTIYQMSQALFDSEKSFVVHFDCAVESIKKRGLLNQTQKIVYLGSNKFAVVEDVKNSENRSGFKIIKTYETANLIKQL